MISAAQEWIIGVVLLIGVIGEVLQYRHDHPKKKSEEEKFAEFYGIPKEDAEFIKSLVGQKLTKDELQDRVTEHFGAGYDVHHNGGFTTDSWTDIFYIMLNGKKLNIYYKYSPLIDKVLIYQIK